MQWVPGTLIAGYGVASGRAQESPYPAGTIALQTPLFLEHGIDLSTYFPGTLNVDLAPVIPVPHAPLFDGKLRWFRELEERFLLTPVSVRAAAGEFAGLWYYPHPHTKPAHLQRATVVELLLPWIPGLSPGARIEVGLPDGAAAAP
jgi:hypothetical protein